jgi:hypothetical protein
MVQKFYLRTIAKLLNQPNEIQTELLIFMNEYLIEFDLVLVHIPQETRIPVWIAWALRSTVVQRMPTL